jgi:hypothetical protein
MIRSCLTPIQHLCRRQLLKKGTLKIFNVAMSRARDRIVLVRSVTSSDLKRGDLKLQVIQHFRNPMGDGTVAARKDILDVCDRGFEKEFGAQLIDMGFRIRAQVPVGGFRIDFVVEGANDRRPMSPQSRRIRSSLDVAWVA